jgi:hypothetical protein
VNHIETFSMLESLQRMVGAADQSNANVPASDLKWLPHTTILQHLTSKYVLLAIWPGIITTSLLDFFLESSPPIKKC